MPEQIRRGLRAEYAIVEFGKLRDTFVREWAGYRIRPRQQAQCDAKEKQHVDLSDPNLLSLILRLAIPSVVGLSIHALQQVVNAIFVGALGAQAIAAVSMTLPIVVLLAAAGQGIGVGTASFISRHLGARDYLEASRGASTALALTAPIGIIVTLALLPNLPAIFATLGATPTIMPVALDYAGTVLLGYTPMLLNTVSGFIVRAEGYTRLSMWAMMTAFILNAVLDPIFIFSLDLGVRGAALATLVSQIAAVGLYIAYFTKLGGQFSSGYLTYHCEQIA
ncbi:MATE family efflux transporter [Bradyrhizobium sp. RDM12]